MPNSISLRTGAFDWLIERVIYVAAPIKGRDCYSVGVLWLVREALYYCQASKQIKIALKFGYLNVLEHMHSWFFATVLFLPTAVVWHWHSSLCHFKAALFRSVLFCFVLFCCDFWAVCSSDAMLSWQRVVLITCSFDACCSDHAILSRAVFLWCSHWVQIFYVFVHIFNIHEAV